MLIIKFPSISVQPLYEANDASDSIGGLSSLSACGTLAVLQTNKT